MLAAEAQVLAPSFSRDGHIIKSLALQSGPSKPYVLGQAQTWLNAFCEFRKLEDNIGLPEGDRETQAYFLLLTVLIASGDYLLGKLDANDKVLHDFTGVSPAGFKGCVDLLKDSLAHLQRQLTPAQLDAIKQRAFDGQAAA